MSEQDLGWFKVHRKLFKKAVWKASTPEQKTILITLLSMVNYTPNEWEFKGEKFTCQPGQMVTSLESVKKEAGKNISIKNVRTALVRFEKYGFLANVSAKQNRLITICNWDTYQSNDSEGGKADGKQVANDRQTGGKRVATIKERKKEKKERSNTYPPAFESFWKAYPRRIGKLVAYKSWVKISPDDDLVKVILKSVEVQSLSEQWKRDDGQFIPHPATWLNNERWEDDVGPVALPDSKCFYCGKDVFLSQGGKWNMRDGKKCFYCIECLGKKNQGKEAI